MAQGEGPNGTIDLPATTSGIGVSPPDDHPHVYLAMGSDDTVLCPYCSTSYRFDLRLGSSEADPPDSVYLDPAVEAKSERSSFEQEPRRKAREHEADSLGDSGDGGSAAPLPLPLMDPAPAHGSRRCDACEEGSTRDCSACSSPSRRL